MLTHLEPQHDISKEVLDYLLLGGGAALTPPSPTQTLNIPNKPTPSEPNQSEPYTQSSWVSEKQNYHH